MASFEWIDADGRFKLAVRPRPGSPIDRGLAAWQAAGAQRIISLQTEEEAARMGLAREPEIARTLGISFERFPIRDHTVPDDAEATIGFARTTLEGLLEGKATVMHCYAGIGRSGLMAILVLVLSGYQLEEAQRRATNARGFRVPENALQWRWLSYVTAMVFPNIAR